MAGELIPPELSIPDLPPEPMEDDIQPEPLIPFDPTSYIPGPEPPEFEDNINEEDITWDGMETNDVSTVTAVIGPEEDIMEDDDLGMDIQQWEADNFLDPNNIETQAYLS